MQCAAHPDRSAERRCASCDAPLCDECARYAIDGAPACDTCGSREHAKSRAVGSVLLGLIVVSYLATLAVAVLLFRPRPFVGGLAAIVAIALGRGLHVILRPRAVTRLTA